MEKNWDITYIYPKDFIKGENLYNQALNGKVLAISKTVNNKVNSDNNFKGKNLAKIIESD